jgi:threonine dehydrogenase-like Zn-dependent dehydrogenase
MKAARFYAAKDLRVDNIPEPTPRTGQVIVDIEWCGICGSDLHEYIVGPRMIPSTTPHVITGEVLPVTMGHEFCGRVSHVPEGETRLKVGQPVMCDPRMHCKACLRCDDGKENMCYKMGFLGLSGGGGGLAEKVAIDARMCYPLPENIDLKFVALIEPLVVARHALKVSEIKKWEELNVLIVGGGPVGVAVVLDLKCHGAKKIIVSEPSSARRKGLEAHGIAIIDPLTENAVARCEELAGQGGVDIVFDCAGIQPGLESGMAALKVRGTYVNVAGWEKPVRAFNQRSCSH